MPFLIERLLNRLHPRSLISAAVSVKTLHPPSEFPTQPALHLPGDFDNIISVINTGRLELERQRTFGEPHLHLPTIQYELRDVRISGQYLASRGRVGAFPTSRPSSDGPDVGRLKDAFLSSNLLSGKEFGHWVRDSLVSELLGSRLDLPRVALARQPWDHEPGFRRLSELDCLYMHKARIDRLIMVDDRGINAHWAERFLELRRRVRTNLATSSSSQGELIFLERGGQSRVREPTNQAEIRSALEGLGFRTVTAIDLSVEEIGEALRNARLVVSVEGSQLNHVHYFAPDKATVLIIQDPRRYYSFHYTMINMYGDRFGFLMGRPDPDVADRYRVDIGDLKRLIDLTRKA